MVGIDILAVPKTMIVTEGNSSMKTTGAQVSTYLKGCHNPLVPAATIQ